MVQNQAGFLAQRLQQGLVQLQQGLALLGGETEKGALLHGKDRVGYLAEELLPLGRDPYQLVFPVIWHILQLEKAALLQLFQGGVDSLLAKKQFPAQLALADTAARLPQGVKNPERAVGQAEVPGQTVVDPVVLLV